MINMNNLSNSKITTFLQKSPCFNALPKIIINEIAEQVQIINLTKGDVLVPTSESAYFYIIAKGLVTQSSPELSLHSTVKENDFLGINLTTKELTYQHKISATEDCLLYCFNYSLLTQQIAEYPNILKQINSSLRPKSQINPNHSNGSPVYSHQYMRPSHELMNTKLALVCATDTIQSVAHKMRNIVNISCAFVIDDLQNLIGIITDKDITQRVVAEALDVQLPISTVMTEKLYTVDEHDLVMEAVQLMTQYSIQNIPVLDNKQHVVGYITPKNLIQNNGAQSVYLVDKIRRADSLQQLIALSHQRNAAFKEIMESTSSPTLVGQILTTIYDAFNIRLIELALKQFGPAPCSFSWIVAGSHARNEVHLASDQDNALILDENATKSDQVYFKLLSMNVCKNLAELGYTLCKGRFMAATPKWCQNVQIWEQYYQHWSNKPELDSLLNLNVFIEVRHIYGDKALFQRLDKHRQQQINNNVPLCHALVKNALRSRPPLGLFNHLLLEKDEHNNKVLNIKKAAIGCINDIVRIYAVTNNCPEISTNARVKWLHQSQVINKVTYQDLIGTYQYVTQLRYQHQQQSIENKTTINNLLIPNLFGSFEQKHLKESFRIISSFHNLFKMKYRL